MKRFFVLVGTWAAFGIVAGACLAADPKKTGNQPPPPGSSGSQPAHGGSGQPSSPTGNGGRRIVPPSNGRNSIELNSRISEALREADAARRAADAAAQRSNPRVIYGNGYNRYYPSYGYLPYGYTPYGYSNSPYGYYPAGTTPYYLGYDSSTGSTFLYPYAGGNSPYYPSYGYQYPYYRNPYLGFSYPGAVFADAGQLYGLGPIQQLMGVGGWSQQPQANANGFANGNLNQPGVGNGAINPNPGFANNNNAHPDAARRDTDTSSPARKPVPAGGGKAMELAWKFITFGDAHFGNQKYNDAMDRYRRAARECPKLGDAWFRQGFALSALGRYDQAAKAMRRGLEEKPDWVDNNFRLSDIYGDDTAEKKSQLDKMVKAAEEEPNNGDLAFVVAVHLYCDGKTDEAAPFFRRAARIRGTDAEVKSFLASGK